MRERVRGTSSCARDVGGEDERSSMWGAAAIREPDDLRFLEAVPFGRNAAARGRARLAVGNEAPGTHPSANDGRIDDSGGSGRNAD
jgi:hypothetical protein